MLLALGTMMLHPAATAMMANMTMVNPRRMNIMFAKDPVGWHEPDHGQSDGEPDGGYEQRMGSCKRAYRRHAVPLSLAGSK